MESFNLKKIVPSLVEKASPLSVLHGRSRSIYSSDWGWLSFKGCGWTWGKSPVLVSKKDAQLVFGLFGKADAVRESKVSDWLLRFPQDASRVLGWLPALEAGSFPSEIPLDEICYNDGTLVEPVVLVTQSLCPWRVADFGFMSSVERTKAVETACHSRQWSPRKFCAEFATQLGSALARLHLAGGTNDTLTYDNITLAAEWIDFEWLYVPGIELPDGCTDQMLSVRQWKSCLDAFEVVDKLCALCDYEKPSRLEHIDLCLGAYEANRGPVQIRDDWLHGHW